MFLNVFSMDNVFLFRRIAKQVVRFSPFMLVNELALLSPEQKSWVIVTRFGSLLSFDMRSYPRNCHGSLVFASLGG